MKNMEMLFERKGIPIYPWYLSDMTSSREMKNVFGQGVKEIFISIEQGFLRGYYDVESGNVLGKFFLHKLISDKNFFEEVIHTIYAKSNELNLFCVKIKNFKDTSSLSVQDLLSLYEEYIRILCSLRVWGCVPVFVDGFKVNFLTDYLLGELENFLSKKGLNNKTSEYYSILSTSEKPSEVYGEMINRLFVAKQMSQSPNRKEVIDLIQCGNIQKIQEQFPDFYGQLEDHRKKYEWLTYAYTGPVMSMEYLLNVLAEDFAKKESVEEQYELAANRHKEIFEEKKLLTKELDLNEQLIYLFNISSELMHIKDWRKGVYQKSYVIMDKIIGEIAKRMNLSLDESKYIVLDEIRDALVNDHLELIRSKAKARTELCCYLMMEDTMEIWEGEEGKKRIEKMVGHDIQTVKDENKNILKGLTAYTGHVTGIARIVLTASDMEKLKEGEILISSATNPDLILAMRRAAAFVTDTGGIISHAAIVSREMKKPCIVGTGNATRFIKDGDIVEVNADKGIVTIKNNV